MPAALAVDPLQRAYLGLFLASTPCTMAAVYLLGGDRQTWAVYNGIAFSSALLFFGPLVSPLVRYERNRGQVGFFARLSSPWITGYSG